MNWNLIIFRFSLTLQEHSLYLPQRKSQNITCSKYGNKSLYTHPLYPLLSHFTPEIYLFRVHFLQETLFCLCFYFHLLFYLYYFVLDFYILCSKFSTSLQESKNTKIRGTKLWQSFLFWFLLDEKYLNFPSLFLWFSPSPCSVMFFTSSRLFHSFFITKLNCQERAKVFSSVISFSEQTFFFTFLALLLSSLKTFWGSNLRRQVVGRRGR